MLECIDDLTFTVPSEKSNWITAANQWRLPYWDWALPHATIPSIYADNITGDKTQITIQKPTAADKSTEESVPNPLYRYRLPKTKDGQTQLTFGTLSEHYKFDKSQKGNTPVRFSNTLFNACTL